MKPFKKCPERSHSSSVSVYTSEMKLKKCDKTVASSLTCWQKCHNAKFLCIPGHIINPKCLCVRNFTRSSPLHHDIKCVTTSYYEDLGLASNATSQEIKESYYR